MKDWLYASDEEVANMTFEEATELIKKHIKLGHESGEFRPRKHITRALEMVLEKALSK